MKRLIPVYALSSNVLFRIVFVWLAAFLLIFGDLRGPAVSPPGLAVANNLAFVTLFGVVHSVVARASFKRIWTQAFPPAAEIRRDRPVTADKWHLDEVVNSIRG